MIDTTVSAKEILRQSAFDTHGRDWANSVAKWQEFRDHYPDDPDGFIFGTLALRENKNLVEAQLLADSVVKVFSNQPRLFVERALICFMTRDWIQARARFAEVRAQFPNEIEGYIRGSEVEQNLGTKQEALSIMELATVIFQNDRKILERYVVLAERLADMKHATAAWRKIRRVYGDEAAFIGEARSLAGYGDPQAAQDLLKDALKLFPTSLSLAAEVARTLTRQGFWKDAGKHWTLLSNDQDLRLEATSRLRDAIRFTVAREDRVTNEVYLPVATVVGQQLSNLLSKTWTLRYGSGHILGQNIKLGTYGELLNYYGEARSWGIIENCFCLFDEHQYIISRLSSIETSDDGQLMLKGRDWVRSAVESFIIMEEQRFSIRSVLNRFESLGNNCEFGLVQRFYGIEPLGLFRFNWADYEALLSGLSDGFSELDIAGSVQIRRSPNDQELIGEVEAYKYKYHTGLYDADISIPGLEESEALRIRYLGRKLIEDLEDGVKIYVRKGEKHEDFDKIVRLHDVMLKIGGCTLLWVTEARTDHPPGTVEVVRAGLLRGYIDRFAPTEAAGRAVFDTWAKICLEASTLVRDSTESI